MADARQHIIILGCGRVGAELALSISEQKYSVTIVDSDARTFERLGAQFRGQTVQGDGIDADVLRRAGLEQAHGFAAVTASDSVNIVASRIARDIYHVHHVVARVYEPHRAPVYERLGLQTISSSSWGARRIEQVLLHPGLQSVYAAGNGEVQVYEVSVPGDWEGRLLSDLAGGEGITPVSISRGGRGRLAEAGLTLQRYDILLVGATTDGARLLRSRLPANGKD